MKSWTRPPKLFQQLFPYSQWKCWIKQDIIFSNVKFHYNDKKSLFKNLNLKITKHSLIGIVGQTGSGKTTIIKLLLRFYDPESGEILIGKGTPPPNRGPIYLIGWHRWRLQSEQLRHPNRKVP